MPRLDRSKNLGVSRKCKLSASRKSFEYLLYSTLSRDKYLMIFLRIYQVINVKSPIDAYRLTTVRVNEMFATCSQRQRDQLIG